MLLSTAFLIVLARANWTWVGGSQLTNTGPSFQQLFVDSPDNSPGGLSDMAYVKNGSFIYVYGGFFHETGHSIADSLWRFNTQSQSWSAIYVPSTSTNEFGVRGVFSPSVQPAVKTSSSVFFDRPLNSMFVFGGLFDFDQLGNSLFEFNFDSFLWRWIHGSATANDPGNAGQLGVESPLNVPAGRAYFAHFYDQATRKAYVYGGRVSANRARADHWAYSVENNTWTWIHGIQNINAPGVYLEMGVGTQLTRPGARNSAAYVYDETRRKFYFYGGQGTSESTTWGTPTDFWQYEPDRNVWTFLAGNRDSAQRSNDGTIGVTQVGTFPRSRYGGQMAVDADAQKVYVFSGSSETRGYMNDLWVLDLNSLLWTLVANTAGQNTLGSYGTKGVSSPLNNPPGRSFGMLIFLNETRQLLLYGGFRVEYLADLWLYSIPAMTQSVASSAILTSTTTKAATTTRRMIRIGTATSSALSADVVGIFVAVPLSLVILLILVVAYVRSRRLKQFDKNSKPSQTFSTGTTVSTTINKSSSITANVTLAPTSLGLSLPAHLEVNELDFRSGELIASGGGGDVFAGEAFSDELLERCRLIVVKRAKITNDISMKLFEQEISVMFLLSRSQFVAKILGFMLHPPVMLIKMYPDGSLMSFATKRPPNRKWKLRFSMNVAIGLRDIHSAHIAHCDMKPQNVLIDRDPNNKPFCVITDFGIAQVLSEKLIVVKYSQAISVKGLSVKYAAPEVFWRFRNKIERNEPHVMKSSDVYAFGMCLYFLLSRTEPWK